MYACDHTSAPKPVQTPLTCIMPIKSPADYLALSELLKSTKATIDIALDSVKTVHFARFVFLQNNTQLAIITTFDGTFQDYISDFATHIGPIFDALFQHIEAPPPLPVKKNTDAFIAWVDAHDVKDSGFYSAYPKLKVVDIKAEQPVAAE